MKIIQLCEDCQEPPVLDEEKSNENWKVYSTKCPKCGGRIKIKVVEE